MRAPQHVDAEEYERLVAAKPKVTSADAMRAVQRLVDSWRIPFLIRDRERIERELHRLFWWDLDGSVVRLVLAQLEQEGSP